MSPLAVRVDNERTANIYHIASLSRDWVVAPHPECNFNFQFDPPGDLNEDNGEDVSILIPVILC